MIKVVVVALIIMVGCTTQTTRDANVGCTTQTTRDANTSIRNVERAFREAEEKIALRRKESAEANRIAKEWWIELKREYLETIPVASEIRTAIYRGVPIPGMDEIQLTVTMGAHPTRTNTTVTINGTREQRVYRYNNTRTLYVYLTNGVVTAIQRSR